MVFNSYVTVITRGYPPIDFLIVETPLEIRCRSGPTPRTLGYEPGAEAGHFSRDPRTTRVGWTFADHGWIVVDNGINMD